MGFDAYYRLLHTSLRRDKLRRLTDIRPISVAPILCSVVEKMFVQKSLSVHYLLKPLIEALNDSDENFQKLSRNIDNTIKHIDNTVKIKKYPET
jgi:hypothetical protein